MELVPGRECGECSVCCVVQNVDTPEFQKFPGVPCTHLKPQGGCGIYATRFQSCRSYHCGWRYLPKLGDGWRPDRSGILVDFQMEDLPSHYPNRPGVRLTVVGPKENCFNPAFLDFVAQLIAAEVPVSLAVPGPPRHYGASSFLNDGLEAAGRARDFAQIEAFFVQIFAALEGHKFDPVTHSSGTNS